MKKILFISGIGLCICLLFAACEKDDITPAIDFPHLYEIVDNPADPVQHKCFELYKTYHVPVYFNDTIARTFVRFNRQGDSVFRVETLDMPWKFTSVEDNTFWEYVFLTGQDEKLKALYTVEKYLESLSVPLRPFSVLVAKSAVVGTKDATRKLGSYVGYRVVLITGAEDLDEEATLEMAAKLKKDMVAYKVTNYTEELNAFNKISKEWYNTAWANLPGVDEDFSSSQKTLWGSLDEEELAEIRLVVGKFGFLGGKNDNVISWIGGGSSSPENKDTDLKMYLDEMLKYPKDVFKSRWGHAPLVMEKYAILYRIIAEKLEVEL